VIFVSIPADRRDAALDLMADHVLREGLAAATLRPLAAAAGTSDRMLLYYFADKDELLTAILDRIATRLVRELDAAIPIGSPCSFAVLLKQVWTILGSKSHRPYMNIWLDLASGAARGLQPHRNVAGAIADGYLTWVTGRLEPRLDGAPAVSAPLFLAAIEGLYLLNAIGRPAIAQAGMVELLAIVSAA